MVMERLKQKRWLRVVLYCIVLAGLSIGLYILFQYLVSYFNIPIERLASTAYLVIFVIVLLSNAAVLVPAVYPHLSLMIAATQYLDPFFIALVSSVAGALGEITAYYAGYLGKRITRLEKMHAYQKLVRWMDKNGFWGILLLSFQPILPVDIAGLLAGASKLPLWKFLVPCWIGKFGKYLLACYLGEVILNLLPPLPF